MANNTPSYSLNAFDASYNAFKEIFQTFMRDIDTIIPAEVIEYKNNLADVRILLEYFTTSGEIIKNGIIYNIPVMMLFGGNCQITFKLAKGDKGLLFACKNDIQGYKKTKASTATDNNRNFDFANGVFLPVDFNNVGDGIIIKNSETVINVLDGEIKITANKTTIDGDSDISGTLSAGVVKAGNGASGTFIDTGTGASGKMLTIQDGIITEIS